MMIQLRVKHIAQITTRVLGTFALFMLAFLFASPTAEATHIVGGDLTYRCLGGNQWEVRLVVRRDCLLGDPEAQFDDPASVGFFDPVTNQLITNVGVNGQLRIPYSADDTLNQIFISDCTIAGNDVCVHQTVYVDTILLPFRPTGYLMSYMRCCRNQSIQNIIDPLNTGMTLIAFLGPLAQAECNSSPQFTDYPPIYVCVNEPMEIAQFANDVDGDSLVYSLCTPFAGGTQINNRPQPPLPPPYDNIDWLDPPYNLENVMGGVPLAIDPVTGMLSGTPSNIGQFVVGICVEAFNEDGILINRTRRDFQFNVRMCRDVPEADFVVDEELDCDDLLVEFSNMAENADEYFWIFDYPNPNSDTSTDPNPIYTYAQGGFYDVALIVNDADSICLDTIIKTIGVFDSQVFAEFQVQVPECADEIFVAPLDFSQDPDPNFDIESWLWILTYGAVSDTMEGQNPTFMINSEQDDVTLYLQVTSENGCTADTAITFDASIVGISFDSSHVCKGDTVILVSNPNPDFTYTWEPDSTIITTPPFAAFPTETTTYNVTVTDGFCTVVDQVTVQVQDLPDLAFEASTDCKSLDIQTLNTSQNGVNYFWDFGDPNTMGDTSTLVNPSYTYDSPGTYIITLFSADGCDVQTKDTIIVSRIEEEFEDETISCFFEDVVLNPDHDPDYIYMWAPSEFLNDTTLPNPTATIEGNMTFYVTVIDEYGCMIEDSIRVVVPDDFNLSAPPDTAYCGSPQVTLVAGNPELDYMWTDSEGNPLSDNGTLVVQPGEETSYILTGTDENGCEKSDTVTLSPTFFDIETYQDTVLCPGDSVWIGVINMDPTQDLDFFWTPGGSILQYNDDSSAVLVQPDVNTTYTVGVMNNTVGCMQDETIQVNVTNYDFNMTQPSLICLGETLQITIVNNDTTDFSYIWEPMEYIVEGGNTCCPIVAPVENTEFCVTIINNSFDCVLPDTCVFVEVSWFDPDSLEVYVEPDSIIINESVNLSTNMDPDLDFMWSGPGLSDPTSPTPTGTPVEDGQAMWCVTVTNADGCSTENCVSSTVIDPLCDERDIYLPNVFSPNDDGANDVLFVRGNYVIGMELRIYNRWGQEVFFSNDQSIGWDGTFEGEQLAPDVFGFILEVECPNEESYTKKGSITLVR